MSKDLWFAEMTRIEAELIDLGMDPDAAYEKASEMADGAVRDRLADMIDMERLRRKEAL